MSQYAATIARAVADLVAEHGVPNKFSAGEIGAQSRLSAMTVGRACLGSKIAINLSLVPYGLTFADYKSGHDGRTMYLAIEPLS